MIFDFDSGFPVVLGLNILENFFYIIYKLRDSVKQPTLVLQKSEFEVLITSYYSNDLQYDPEGWYDGSLLEVACDLIW